MKQNFMSGMMIAVLPLGLATHQNQTLSSQLQIQNQQQVRCEAISSIEFPQSKTLSISEKKIDLELFVEKQDPVTPQPVVKKAPVPAPEELEQLFTKYSAEYGISSDALKIIANCESHYNPNALSKNGLYGGMFQFSASTWKSTRKAMGLDENPDLRFNAEEAIRTTAYKISKNGVGAWPHCGKKVNS